MVPLVALKQITKKTKGDKPWFNHECKFERQNYRKLKRKYKKIKTERLKREVTEAETRYKKTLDKHSKSYRREMRKKFKNLKSTDPKEYWNLLNRGKEKKTTEHPSAGSF